LPVQHLPRPLRLRLYFVICDLHHGKRHLALAAAG